MEARKAVYSARHWLSREYKYKWTPLHVAAAIGWSDGIQALLDDGADPFATNGADEYPLSCAMKYGSLKCVQLLLDTDFTQYQIKCTQGCKLLWDTVLGVESDKIKTAFIQTFVDGYGLRNSMFPHISFLLEKPPYRYDLGILERLYNCGYQDFTEDEELGRRLLMEACWQLKVGLVEFYLSKGLSITKRAASGGASPLHCLVFKIASSSRDGAISETRLSWISKIWRAVLPSRTMHSRTCLCQDDILDFELFTVFLRSVPSYNIRLFGFRKLIESFRLTEEDMHTYCRAFSRFEIFTRLGMTHTCGYFCAAGFYEFHESAWVPPLDRTSKEEIEEEECEFASQLETMMAAYDIASAKTTEEPNVQLERYLDETIGLEEQLPAEEEEFYRGFNWGTDTDLLNADESQLGSYSFHSYKYYISTYGERVRCKHNEVCKEPYMLRLLFGEED